MSSSKTGGGAFKAVCKKDCGWADFFGDVELPNDPDPFSNCLDRIIVNG
jgi:hypothetical protein